MSADSRERVRIGEGPAGIRDTQPSRRLLLWAAAVLGLGAVIVAWVVYVRSPGYVVDATVRALNARDVDGLLDLASDYEKRALGLTSENVTAFLKETWWKDPKVHPSIRFTLRRVYYADQLAYVGEVRGFAPGGRAQVMLVEVYRDKAHEWRLGLSRLLWVSCPIAWNQDEEGDYDPGLRALLRRVGIKAAVSMDGAARYADGSGKPRLPLAGH